MVQKPLKSALLGLFSFALTTIPVHLTDASQESLDYIQKVQQPNSKQSLAKAAHHANILSAHTMPKS